MRGPVLRWMLGVACLVGAFCLAGPPAADAGPMTGGLQLWLDANDSSTLFQDAGMSTPVTAAGQNVAGWADKSTLGNHATTGGTAPTFQTGVIGSQDVLRFNRTPLTVSGGLNVANGQDRTIFLVNRFTTNNGNSEIFGRSTGLMIDFGSFFQQQRLRLRDTVNGGPGDDGFSGYYSGTGSVPFGNHLISLRATGAGTFAEREGTTILNRPGQFAQHYDLSSGNVQVGGANFTNREYIGDLAEILVYDREVNRYEYNATGYYLQDKYGLPGTFTDGSPPVTSGLALWLDAPDTGTVSVDGSGNVTQWRDKSGGGHDATPIHGTPGPTWVENAIGDLPAIDYVQSGRDVMSVAGDLGIADGQPRTLFAVFDYDTLLPNNEMLGNSTGQMVDIGTYTPTGAQSNRLRFRDGSTNVYSDPGDLPFGPQILIAQGSDDGILAWQNNTKIIDTASDPFSYAIGSTFKIGGTDFNTRDFDGRLAEVLLFDRALSELEIRMVGDYLSEKYLLGVQFVPEPATALLLALGGLLLAVPARRRRRRA